MRSGTPHSMSRSGRDADTGSQCSWMTVKPLEGASGAKCHCPRHSSHLPILPGLTPSLAGQLCCNSHGKVHSRLGAHLSHSCSITRNTAHLRQNQSQVHAGRIPDTTQVLWTEGRCCMPETIHTLPRTVPVPPVSANAASSIRCDCS